MAIAFFDLDRTLLSFNSATRWVKSELRQGELSLLQAIEAFGWIARYHLGFADIEAAVRHAVRTLADKPEQVIVNRTRVFYETQIRGRFRPGALRVLSERRAQGDRLVLLTSSSPYLSELVVGELGLDDFLCTRFEVDPSGHFTGLAVEPLCFGPGKVMHAAPYAARFNANLAQCAYYGDSMADLAMLQAVGSPVAVNPDPRLKRIAHLRRWPVVDWGATL